MTREPGDPTMPAIYTQAVAAILKRDLRRSLMRACISVMTFLLRKKSSEISAFLQILIRVPLAASTRGFPERIERFEGQDLRRESGVG